VHTINSLGRIIIYFFYVLLYALKALWAKSSNKILKNLEIYFQHTDSRFRSLITKLVKLMCSTSTRPKSTLMLMHCVSVDVNVFIDVRFDAFVGVFRVWRQNQYKLKVDLSLCLANQCVCQCVLSMCVLMRLLDSIAYICTYLFIGRFTSAFVSVFRGPQRFRQGPSFGLL